MRVLWVLFFLGGLSVLAGAALGADGDNVRERVPFDFAWKHHRGSTECAADAFPRNLSGVQCVGLASRPSAQSADACLQVCCADVSCHVWQYEPAKGCWAGNPANCTDTSSAWVGGGRDDPIPPAGPSQPSYNDSTWELIDVPHDFMITEDYDSKDPASGRSYLPRNSSWYRKHFVVPSEWKGSSFWIYFDGVFRYATVYFNGQQIGYHHCGYTSFHYRLDNASVVNYGTENVLAVYVDALSGSGWWYEGGGINRHVYLVRAGRVHITEDGIFAPASVTGHIDTRSSPTDGLFADAMVNASALLVNDDTADLRVCVRFTAFAPNGSAVATVQSSSVNVPAHGGQATASGQLALAGGELWSIPRPYVYTLAADILTDCLDGVGVIDSVNVTFGVRTIRYDADTGFYLNSQSVKIRGFCNHNSFAALGIALPDRVQLFRAHALQSVGGNGWRMSHNPPSPVLLDILDQLGVVVMDENRLFGNDTEYVSNMGDLVRRDRNHPSVAVWSFCNEAGCSGSAEDGGDAFKAITYLLDGTRPVLANMNGDLGGKLSHVIDVQGFSHSSRSTVDSYHTSFPNKPLYMSECCSCASDRSSASSSSDLKDFTGSCVESQTNVSNAVPYVAGTMVWTLFDYYGEPFRSGWPRVSSSYGQYDLAGFPKSAVYWYRAWWLYNIPSQSPDRPALFGHLTHIVDDWLPGSSPRNIHVYSDSPSVELFVNGVSVGRQSITPAAKGGPSYAGFANVPFQPGNLTAVGQNAAGEVESVATFITPGAEATVVLTIDAPWGDHAPIVADGQDVALLRATIVDGEGYTVSNSSTNVTFTVLSGPGRIIGSHNGDPQCHEPNHAPWHSAYQGLVRGFVQVTQISAGPASVRARLAAIDMDGGVRTTVVVDEVVNAPVPPIVVQACADGLKCTTVSVPVSSDMRFSPRYNAAALSSNV